jgi:hypothetical protein
MAFVERQINISFDLSSGTGSSAKITGKRISCKIVNAGSPSMGTADLAIYGLPLSMMNQLSTIGTQINLINKNSITIEAGDAQSGMSLVFKGTISLAWVDAQSQPEVSFRVSAFAGLYEAVAATEPTSVQGSADVAKTLQQIAQKAGLGFEGASIDAKVSNPYLPGSAREQILRLANMAGLAWTIENERLVVVKPGTPRAGGAVMISPETGMVGYPAFNQAGVIVRKIFDPSLLFFSKITVRSELTPACGDWVVHNICHDIESQVPNGQWFTVVEAHRIESGGDIPGGEGD